MPTALQLPGQPAGALLRQALVAALAERGHRRPLGERRLEPRDTPTLLVDTHPERHVRNQARRLKAQLGDLLGLGDIAGKQDDAP